MNINQDKISAAASIFEQENGSQIDDYDKELISCSGFDLHNPDAVEKVICGFIESNIERGHELLGSAIFAIGKRFKASNKEYLQSILERIIEHDIDAAYQTMIALDNIGEEIFHGSASLLEKEKNYELGKEYLKNQRI